MKIKYIQVSYILSLLSFITTMLINIQIVKTYLKVDGKTRALFSLMELQYGYQYYVSIVGLTAFFIALFAPAYRNQKIIAAVLALLSIAFVFARVWRLFI